MEFMYCIPNLEAFIDKTIKKCLLEYDLDSNDTEAVLDDMEKAWPESSPKPQDKSILKDCNENGRSALLGTVPNQERKLLNVDFEKIKLKGVDTLMVDSIIELDGRLHSKEEELTKRLTNGKCMISHMDLVDGMSDSSGPDVIGRNSLDVKHPKLKSRLQQRYFQGRKESNNNHNRTTDNTVQNAHDVSHALSSNLDLLASVANIHVDSTTQIEKRRIQIIQSLRAESEQCFMDITSKKSCKKRSSVCSQPAREVPMTSHSAFELASSSSSSKQRPLLQYNNFNFKTVPNGCKLRINEHNICSKLSTDSPTHKQRQTSTMPRSQERATTSSDDVDNTMDFSHYYKKGKNDLTPQGHGVKRKHLSPDDFEKVRETKIRHIPTLFPQSTLSTDSLTDCLKSQKYCHPLATNFHHHHTSNSFLEPHSHHGPRLSSIIAEELQKDNISNENSPSRQSIHSVDRINWVKPKYLSPKETDQFSPEPCNKDSPKELSNSPSSLGTGNRLIGFNDSAFRINSNSKHSIAQSLFVTSNHSLGTTIKAAHLAYNVTAVTSFTGFTTFPPGNHVGMSDDQPEDLSVKRERKTGEDMSKGITHSDLNTHLNFHTKDNARSGYFSSPGSPLSAPTTNCHFEYLASRITSSPSNKSDGCCDYNSGSDTKRKMVKNNGKWEKTGSPHSLGVYTPEDNGVLNEKRREDNTKRWLEEMDSEINDNRMKVV